MTIIVLLVIAALIFGVGGVIKGLLWVTLIGVALVVVAAVTGSRVLRK